MAASVGREALERAADSGDPTVVRTASGDILQVATGEYLRTAPRPGPPARAWHGVLPLAYDRAELQTDAIMLLKGERRPLEAPPPTCNPHLHAAMYATHGAGGEGKTFWIDYFAGSVPFLPPSVALCTPPLPGDVRCTYAIWPSYPRRPDFSGRREGAADALLARASRAGRPPVPHPRRRRRGRAPGRLRLSAPGARRRVVGPGAHLGGAAVDPAALRLGRGAQEPRGRPLPAVARDRLLPRLVWRADAGAAHRGRRRRCLSKPAPSHPACRAASLAQAWSGAVARTPALPLARCEGAARSEAPPSHSQPTYTCRHACHPLPPRRPQPS